MLGNIVLIQEKRYYLSAKKNLAMLPMKVCQRKKLHTDILQIDAYQNGRACNPGHTLRGHANTCRSY